MNGVNKSVTRNRPNIGIIMLNTSFPRPVGDVGNIESYRYPAHILQLVKANVANVVTDQLDDTLVQEVVDAAVQLKSNNVNILTTSCGFLAPIQQIVQERVGIPFIASSLCLLPFLRQMFGHQSKIGILTFDSTVLSPNHFNGNFDNHLIVSGIERGKELHRVIKQSLPALEEIEAEQDVLEAVEKLIQENPMCILLECTNLSPYKDAIRERFQIPVFDLVDAVHWLADAY